MDSATFPKQPTCCSESQPQRKSLNSLIYLHRGNKQRESNQQIRLILNRRRLGNSDLGWYIWRPPMIHWLVQGFLFGALIISISLSSSSCSSSTPTPAASPTAKNTSAIIQPPVTATTSSATLTASPTLGSVYFVNPSGNDSNTGRSESSAFRTIQRASNVSIAGDTILVMNGTYTNDCADCYVVEITRSGTATNWITYKAYHGHNPVLKFNG